MSCCCPSQPDRNDSDPEDIELQPLPQPVTQSAGRVDHRSEIIRLFIVGCGEVGKSTLVKQMQNLCLTSSSNYRLFDEVWDSYQVPFSDQMRLDYRPKMYQNVFRIIGTLIEKVRELELHFDSEENEGFAAEIMECIGEDVTLLYQKDIDLEPHFAPKILALWKDRGIQSAWHRRREYQISDSATYFLKAEKLQEMATPTYRPTADDIIRVRDPTVGIKDYNFLIHKVRFCVTDVGGQATERARLIFYLEDWLKRGRPQDRNFMLYVAALSDYDQKKKDSDKTLLDESIEFLKVLLDLPQLMTPRRVGFILFLNKEDIFEEKLYNFADFPEFFLEEIRAQESSKKRGCCPVYDRILHHLSRFSRDRGRLDDRQITLAAAKNIVKKKIEKEMESTRRPDEAVHVKYTRAVDAGMMEGIFYTVKDFVLAEIFSGHQFP